MNGPTMNSPAKNTPAQPVGTLLRQWRQRRRLSQLDLACDAEISTRHLSFVETGRALPSREMLLHLAEQLDIPLRERNRLLSAAGYAPVYSEKGLDDPALTVARQAIDQLLKAHEPNPAMVVDRHWNLLASNRTVDIFLIGVDPELLQPPINVLRMSLHPKGLAPRILNLGPWKAHVVERLQRDFEASGDPALAALRDEVAAYPAPPYDEAANGDMVLIPVQLQTELGVCSLIGTITVFGTPVDVTLSELALETFFPADPDSARILRQLSGSE